MYVKSGVKCPLCGKEMRMTDGAYYYNNELGAVRICCDDCDLTVYEFGFLHGFKDSEAQSYNKLVKALISRVKGAER